MKTKSLRSFSGLDLRNLDEVTDPTALREAVNVELTVGKGIKVRSQLRLWATLDPNSVGLYTTGGTLRAAVPFRVGTVLPRPPAGVAYDYINNHGTSGYDATVPVHVTAAAAWFSKSYLVIQRPGLIASVPSYEHHYLGANPVAYTSPATAIGTSITLTVPLSAALMATIVGCTVRFAGSIIAPTGSYLVTAVTDNLHISIDTVLALPTNSVLLLYQPTTTKVTLPFEPGPAATVHADRVWAGSLTDRTVPYSTTTDPTNWTDPDDAGFLATTTHIDGDQPVNGLAVFRNLLCILYQRNIQVWNVELRDPACFSMAESVGGAGTKFPKTVANVMGDLMYFSEGGFRTLDAVITTGQPKDGDVGAKITPLTKGLGMLAPPALTALWSPSRSQYLCAAQAQVFVYTNSVTTGTKGWTTFQLPWAVEAMVELAGVVYLRRAGSSEVYIFDDNAAEESNFTWAARLPFHDYAVDENTAHYMKQFKFILPHHQGAAQLDCFLDRDLTTPLATMDLAGDMRDNKVPLHVLGEMLSLRFSGAEYYLFDELLIRYDIGNLV